MSRRDYKVIAKAFADSYVDHTDDPEVCGGVDVALANVTRSLASLNSGLDKNKFLAEATKTRPGGTP